MKLSKSLFFSVIAGTMFFASPASAQMLEAESFDTSRINYRAFYTCSISIGAQAPYADPYSDPQGPYLLVARNRAPRGGRVYVGGNGVDAVSAACAYRYSVHSSFPPTPSNLLRYQYCPEVSIYTYSVSGTRTRETFTCPDPRFM